MVRLLLCAWLALAVPCLGAEEGPGTKVKEGVKSAGKAVGEAGEKVGHAVRDGAKAVGHGARKVGHGVRDGAKAVGHGVKSAVKGD